MPQSPHIKHTGAAKTTVLTPGRMQMSMENAVKSVIGSNHYCYVCKTDVTEGVVYENSVNIGIRKIGKKYKKVMFHIACEEKNES